MVVQYNTLGPETTGEYAVIMNIFFSFLLREPRREILFIRKSYNKIRFAPPPYRARIHPKTVYEVIAGDNYGGCTQ